MACGVPSLRQVLETCCPADFIRARARDLGVIKRQRKVSVVALFWTLVLGGGEGIRTLTGLRQAYQNATGTTIASSAFQNRFTESLAQLMREAVVMAMSKLAEPVAGLQGRLQAFLDLVVVDSSVLRLPDKLAEAYPGCRTNHSPAAMKLNVVTSVGALSPRGVKLTSERRPESKMLAGGKWMEGRLLLFDLGYFSYRLFHRISQNRGFFVTRLKENANPRVVESLRTCRGRSVDIAGQKLRSVLGRLQREVLDCLVEVEIPLRPYRGVQRRVSRVFRVVGLQDPKTEEYHLYLTNVSHETLSAEEVGRVYACRWEIELLFKELKSGYHLDELPSENVHAVHALVYASILTLIASRKLLHAMRKYRNVPPSRTPERRWARCFRRCMEALLNLICKPSALAAQEARRLATVLGKEFIDPNASRARNLDVCRA